MADNLLQMSFGSLRLYAADVDTDGGRSLVVHEPTRGDLFDIQDRGGRLRRTRCELVFCAMPREPEPPLERYKAFAALVEEGKPQIFVHPIHGSYLAKVGELGERITGDSSEIRCSAEFLQDAPLLNVTEVSIGVDAAAAPEGVAVQAGAVDDALEAAGLSSSVPGSVAATAAAWGEADEPDSRTVFAELGSAIDDIDQEVARLDLEASLDSWESYKQFMILRSRLVDTAGSVASVAERVFDLVVRTDTTLRVLCARTYGASEAEERERQVRELNPQLRAPGRVPAGTTLKMPVAGGAR